MALEQFFYENPSPCWIYQCQTLRFIEINKRCVSVYGYSEDEFLEKLLHPDLQPLEDTILLKEYLEEDNTFGDSGVWRHMNKAGHIFHVRILTQPTQLNGQKCMYVMATNVEKEVSLERKFRTAHCSLTRLRNSVFSGTDQVSPHLKTNSPKNTLERAHVLGAGFSARQ